jgi:small-conductance mechanosensitive channel
MQTDCFYIFNQAKKTKILSLLTKTRFETMEMYQLKIIETAALILFYFIFKYFISKAIEKVVNKFVYQKDRVRITRKLINFLTSLVFFVILLFIWGVDQSELLVFVTTTLTILGIAFFAQWSIISNITATIIIFFNHPAKIGDSITIVDKEMPLHGKIHDVGIFFVIIKTDEGDKVTIPSNVFIQKMIKRSENNSPQKDKS